MRISILLCLLFATNLAAETIDEGGASHPGFTATLYGAESFRATDSTQDLRLAPAPASDAILQLRFEEPSSILKDSAGNFKVRANYVAQKNGPMGGFARFIKPENRIELSSPRELWPSDGDFSVEFWIEPVIFYSRNSIFKKVSLLGGQKRGMEIYLESGRLKASFFDLFEDTDGQRHSITLSSHSALPGSRWSHVTLTYDASSGKLALFVDNQEQMVSYAADATGVYRASFHPLDRSAIVIGENYFGSLDEFLITGSAISPEEHPRTRLPSVHISDVSFRPTQQSGMAISEVYDAGSSSSGRFRYTADEPAGSSIQFFIRFSEHAFNSDAPDAGSLKWKRIRNQTDNIGRFRFFQWKALFNADPTGSVSPVLRETTLTRFALEPPARPGGLRAIEELSGGDSVCLEWRNVPEPEIESEGGYIVYYGLKPGEYLGHVRIQNGKPIRPLAPEKMQLTKEEKRRTQYQSSVVMRELSGRTRFMLDNRTIEENIRGKKKGNMPFLRPDRTYYFAVSAYTSQGESEQSKETVAVLRPAPDL